MLTLCINRVSAQDKVDPELVIPIGSIGVNELNFSPSGQYIVTASWDGTAKLWETYSGGLIRNFIGHTAGIYTVKFSNDSRKILTASRDGTAKIWNTQTGEIILTLNGHLGVVNTAEFSPDGELVVTSSDDGTARLWSVTNGQLVNILEGHTDCVNVASFSPDGQFVLTASDDKTARMWDIKNGGELTHNLIGHSDCVRAASFSSDGRFIVTGSFDGTARIWDVKRGDVLSTFECNTTIYAKFSPNGTKLITVDSDLFARLWDTTTGDLILITKARNKSVDFSPDGRFLVTSDEKGTMIRDMETGKVVHSLNHIAALAKFSQDNRSLVTADGFGKLKIWNVTNGRLRNNLGSGAQLILNDGKISPVAPHILIPTTRGAIIWDMESGELLENYDSPFVQNAEFSPDGRYVVIPSRDKTVKIYDSVNKVLLHTLKGHSHVVQSAKFSPDGQKVVTTSYDETAKIWDLKSGILLNSFEEHHAVVDGAEFSKDGRYLVTVCFHGISRVWNLESMELIFDLEGRIHYAEFSTDGSYLMTSGYQTKIWDMRTRKLMFFKEGYHVLKSKFSPDGKLFLNGEWSIAKLRRVDNSEEIFSFNEHKDVINFVEFSPDGKQILTSSTGMIKIWDSLTGSLIKDYIIRGDVVGLNFAHDKLVTFDDGLGILHLYSLKTGAYQYGFVGFDSLDYLVLHPDGYYDGTEAARNLVYFVCNGEVIKLSQMKEALYVPGLVEKIMTGQKINDPKLSDLGICDALPIVTKLDGKKYRYTIRPRRLPLERAEVYVNDKLVLSYPVNQLSSTGDIYELELDEKELDKQLQIGEENWVKVIGVVKSEYGSELRTRGITEPIEKKSKGEVVPPRLFAVMIGVNDYKDPSLRLNYPVKDAKELGKAIESAATKLLGKDNVFMYPIHTEVKPGTGFTTPEKAGIKRALEDIGTKARPEDIVLMFFAGHGEMQGADGKQFTFLTADASRSEHIGISTKELQNWLSYQGPHKMLANKTILIFDACYSGQVNNDFVVQTRNEDPSDRRIKQVEDLKDKSGMFILAGSAPDQAAYELAQYQNGMLTYSLLSVLKKNPGILDDQQFLNVQKWFLESEQKLKEEVESKGLKQDARPFGTANIRIGIVDKEVRESIVLANERPAVYCANVLEFNANDDILLLKDLILKEFMAISTSGSDKSVILASSGSEQINRFNISYLVKDDDIISNIKLLKGAEILLHKDMIGKKSELTKLVKEICEEVIKHAK